jgi:GNAT superfamily N-acetyltransferase
VTVNEHSATKRATPDAIREWADGDYVVTTDRARVDLVVVHRFISEESYWARGRSRDAQTRANEASTCFAVIHAPTGEQVGFARVLHDGVSFGWVADVFVISSHRGRGVGVFLMRCVADAFRDLARLVLGTRDAHGLYAKVGFSPIIRVDRWMERWQEEPNP